LVNKNLRKERETFKDASIENISPSKYTMKLDNSIQSAKSNYLVSRGKEVFFSKTNAVRVNHHDDVVDWKAPEEIEQK